MRPVLTALGAAIALLLLTGFAQAQYCPDFPEVPARKAAPSERLAIDVPAEWNLEGAAGFQLDEIVAVFRIRPGMARWFEYDESIWETGGEANYTEMVLKGEHLQSGGRGSGPEYLVDGNPIYVCICRCWQECSVTPQADFDRMFTFTLDDNRARLLDIVYPPGSSWYNAFFADLDDDGLIEASCGFGHGASTGGGICIATVMPDGKLSLLGKSPDDSDGQLFACNGIYRIYDFDGDGRWTIATRLDWYGAVAERYYLRLFYEYDAEAANWVDVTGSLKEQNADQLELLSRLFELGQRWRSELGPFPPWGPEGFVGELDGQTYFLDLFMQEADPLFDILDGWSHGENPQVYDIDYAQLAQP